VARITIQKFKNPPSYDERQKRVNRPKNAHEKISVGSETAAFYPT
jgi:hypothetical protein